MRSGRTSPAGAPSSPSPASSRTCWPRLQAFGLAEQDRGRVPVPHPPHRGRGLPEVGPPARFPARPRRHQRRVSQPAAAQWAGAPCRAGYPARNAAKPDVANQTRRVRPAVPRGGRVPALDGHGLMLIRNAEPEHIRTAPAVGAFPHRSACPAGQVAPPSLVGSAGVAGRIGSPARVKGRWARTGPGPRSHPARLTCGESMPSRQAQA